MEMDDDDELKDEMINEITTSLDDLDNFLIHLEKSPNDMDCVNEIFRLVHSIKGLSSFFNYTGIEKVAHNGEHLLDLLRTNKLTGNPPLK